MVITLQSTVLRGLVWAVPLFPLALLTGCQEELSSGGSSDQVLVKSVVNTGAYHSAFDAFNEFNIGPDNPYRLTFDTAVDAQSSSGYLLFRNASTEFSSEGNLKPGSLYVGAREKLWSGPLIRFPLLESERAYRVSAWIKLIENEMPSKVSLVLNQVSGGNKSSIPLEDTTIGDGQWHKVQGEFAAGRKANDTIYAFHVEVENTGTPYLLDDVTVSFSDHVGDIEPVPAVVTDQIEPKYINNGDAEEGMAFWASQGGIINLSKVHAYSGESSILITNRDETWNGPVMSVSNLKDNVNYHFCIFARLESGVEPSLVRLTVRAIIDGQAKFVPVGMATVTDGAWVEISGNFRSSKISTADAVSVYLESDNATASYYVDNLSVKAMY